jgi:hypothetical protein
LADYDRSLPLIIDPATLVYCGYIGGDDYEGASGIAVDSSGCAYVAGYTYSFQATFPVLVGPDLTYNGDPWDAFVTKVAYARFADISLSKSVDNIKPYVDDTVAFTVTAANLGP